MHGVSMAPTLVPGDCLLVRRGARVRPGDLVVVRRPLPPSLVLVKRCLRIGGDGRVWVGSDNVEAGEFADDSRAFGGVPPELVVGRVVWRYWPPRRRLRA